MTLPAGWQRHAVPRADPACDLAPKQEALCGLAGTQKLASYTYDPVTGKLHSITAPDGTLTYNYEG